MFAGFKAFFPFFGAYLAALVVPVTLEYIEIVEQDANGLRVMLPHELFKLFAGVEIAEFAEKGLRGVMFVEAVLRVYVGSVGGVEGNPQEDKAAVAVVFQFCALQPTEGAVDTQGEALRELVALAVLLRFECCKVHYRLPGNCFLEPWG